MPTPTTPIPAAARSSWPRRVAGDSTRRPATIAARPSRPPAPLSPEKQARLCLTPAHTGCATYLASLTARTERLGIGARPASDPLGPGAHDERDRGSRGRPRAAPRGAARPAPLAGDPGGHPGDDPVRPCALRIPGRRADLARGHREPGRPAATTAATPRRHAAPYGHAPCLTRPRRRRRPGPRPSPRQRQPTPKPSATVPDLSSEVGRHPERDRQQVRGDRRGDRGPEQPGQRELAQHRAGPASSPDRAFAATAGWRAQRGPGVQPRAFRPGSPGTRSWPRSSS